VAYPSGFKTEYSVYVGDEGMMCFVTGKYSAGLPHAGMLAYVMDNDVSRAWDGLSTAIEDNRISLKLRTGTSFTVSDFDEMTATIIAPARVAETADNAHSASSRDITRCRHGTSQFVAKSREAAHHAIQLPVWYK
jgi:hypothetical protein